ncbi:MAG: 16S rRNA (guanine(966)-N(2))-methyltransferase RsmD [Rhodothermia bacterium]|nr:16S rRNA (guanine(966)-N(2))-methyltransferase RsmD [Rhodothermia bacterium]
MRIISGEFRSRLLKVPPGRNVRPTSDRTRESLFNILGGRVDLEGLSAADLYAGSGSLGLEAISRGASHVTFVEKNALALRTVQENARSLGVSERCRFLRDNVMRFLRDAQAQSLDLAFADPPYDSEDLKELPATALRLIKPGGFLILEHDRSRSFEGADMFVLQRMYGDTVLTFFQVPLGP